MSIEEGRVYVIINAKSRTALDLSGTDGHTISGWQLNDGQNQRWRLTRENNQWVFQNVGNNKYLGLEHEFVGHGKKDDTAVVAVDYPVPWDIAPDERNSQNHRIYVVGTRFNVDLAGYGDEANGTRVSVWGRNENNENQTWYFQQA